MSKRIFTVVCVGKNKNIENLKKIFEKINAIESDEIRIYTDEDLTNVIDCKGCCILPADVKSSSQIHNYICKDIKKANYDGFVYIMQNSIELLDGYETYVNEIEHVMNILDYDIHFSTITDGCNYVYKKYNPRIAMILDDDMMKPLNLPEKIMFTSHSNHEHVIMNFAKYDESKYLMNDSFTIAMFFIIEFLARRRNTKNKNQLYYMNQYLAIPSEKNAYKLIKSNNSGEEIDKQIMQNEDALFKSLNINYAPDNNIDSVFEELYNKILSKL